MATNISIPTYGFVNHILALSEDNWRTFFKPFITDSVQNGLATIAGANMTVYVSAGECRCGAVMGILDEMIALDVANGDSTYDRIDSVIVQYTYGEPSTLAVAIIQGTPSANPVPPTLTKVYDTLWQMEIAQILVPSGATSSSEFTITDKRVIYESIESIIDDNTESEERVWSSQKTHEEIVSLSSEIYDSLNTKADIITKTVSGNIVTITDGGNNIPVKELVVGIEPVQDLNGQANPYPAGGGKNKCPLPSSGDTINQVDFTVNKDGANNPVSITVNGTASGTVKFLLSDNLNLAVGETYTVSGCPSGGGASKYMIRIYDENDTAIATDTGSGATFTYAAGYKAMIVVVNGQTVSNIIYKPQIELGSTATSYVPYENICPISGWTQTNVVRTGRNLLDETDYDYSTATQRRWHSTDGGILLKAGTTYTFSDYGIASGALINLYFKKYSDQSTITSANNVISYTPTEDTIVYLQAYRGDGIPDGVHFQLELGSIATAYESYHGTTLPISWQSEAGMVYGGTLDVLTGEMRVTWIAIDSTAWDYYATSNGYKAYRIQNLPYGSGGGGSGVETPALSNVVNEFGSFSSSAMSKNICQPPRQNSTTAYLALRSDLTATDVQLVYTLATPLTYTLTPAQTLSLLLGDNVLWADTGDILNLTYQTDTKKYIEQKVADTNRKTCEMMTIVTDKMIAPDNLTVGDLVIVNDDLYKVINSNIASGEAMVVGTNVMKITLAEYIQSLI